VLTIWASHGKAAAAVFPLPGFACRSAADRVPEVRRGGPRSGSPAPL